MLRSPDRTFGGNGNHAIIIHIVTKSYTKPDLLTSSDYRWLIHSASVRPAVRPIVKPEEPLWPTLTGTSKPKSRA